MRSVLWIVGLWSLTAVAGCCCGGQGYKGNAKVRWDAYQESDRLARACIDERRYEAAAEIYERLWTQAAAPQRAEGAAGPYAVALHMRELCWRWPAGWARFDRLREPLQAKVLARTNTANEFDAWYQLATGLHNQVALIACLTALRDDRQAVVQFSTPRWRRDEVVKVARSQGRDELARLVGPTALEKAGETAANAALGVVLAPVYVPLGKMIAPR